MSEAKRDRIDEAMTERYGAGRRLYQPWSDVRVYESFGQRLIVQVDDDGTFTIYSFHATHKGGRS